MKLLRAFFLTALTVPALAACADVRQDLGLGRSSPDEFAVVDRPPLAMPPDFGLRPPVPGAPRPQDVDVSQRAGETLLGTSDKPAETAPSASEQALLQETGADKASPQIRVTINEESTQVVDANPHLVDDLLWWKQKPPSGTVVDSAAEAERIQQAKDKGEPLNSSATPIIEQDKGGWLGL